MEREGIKSRSLFLHFRFYFHFHFRFHVHLQFSIFNFHFFNFHFKSCPLLSLLESTCIKLETKFEFQLLLVKSYLLSYCTVSFPPYYMQAYDILTWYRCRQEKRGGLYYCCDYYRWTIKPFSWSNVHTLYDIQ